MLFKNITFRKIATLFILAISLCFSIATTPDLPFQVSEVREIGPIYLYYDSNKKELLNTVEIRSKNNSYCSGFVSYDIKIALTGQRIPPCPVLRIVEKSDTLNTVYSGENNCSATIGFEIPFENREDCSGFYPSFLYIENVDTSYSVEIKVEIQIRVVVYPDNEENTGVVILIDSEQIST